MLRIRFFLIAVTVSLFFMTLSLPGFATAAQEKPIADRDISLAVVTVDGIPVSSNVQGLELKVATITVNRGNSVKQLLAANNVYPDTEAFGFVYDLNPSLASISSVNEGQELTLPKIERRDSQAVLPAGQMVALTLDSRLKTQLAERFETVDNSIATINRFGVERFTDANERSSVLTSLKSINDSFAVIVSVTRGKILPLNNEFLKQVNDEAESLQLTLEELIGTQRKPTADERELIKLVDEDLTLKTRNLNDVRGPNEPPARSGQVLVVVNTVVQDGRKLPLLRIYYVPLARRNNAQSVASFDTLRSPAQMSLPVGNYLIWAGTPDQGTKEAALSDLKSVAVRKSSEPSQSVDLAIIH